MEVEMKIRGLMMDPVTNMPIVILKDAGGDAVLPIWVGIYEANAIALEIEKVATPRPMTHDLIKNVLIGLDTHVKKVVVTELRDDTFYAVIWLERKATSSASIPVPQTRWRWRCAWIARFTWKMRSSKAPSWPPTSRTASPPKMMMVVVGR